MLQCAAVASPVACPYGRVVVMTMEGPPAPPPRQVSEDGFKSVFLKRMEGNSASL